jgi:hypothetical protein
VKKRGINVNLFRTIVANRRAVLLWAMYVLIMIGALHRVFYLTEHNPLNHIWSDPERHWVQGIDTERDDPLTMTDPVMYQLYIAALSKLTFKDPALVAFYTILLSLLTPWAWYKFFRELQPSREVAIGGSLVLVWLPSWLSIYTYFMQETLMLSLLGIALWMTWRCKRKQTLNSFLIMVFVWALAGLTRGICIPMAAVATTWLWIIQAHKPGKAIYSIVILSLILGPLSYRSMQRMGIWAPHGVGQMNVIYAKSGKQEIKMTYRRQGAIWYFGFGSPSTGIAPFEPFSDWRTQRSGKVFATVDIDKGYEDWKRNLEYNRLTFSKYLWITKENLIFLFFGESWPDSDRSYVLGNLNYQMRWIWAPLTIVLIVATALIWRSQKRYLLLPSIIVAWLIVQGFLPLAVNEGRYRKPLEGLLIAQAVLLIGTGLRYRSTENQLTETYSRLADSDGFKSEPANAAALLSDADHKEESFGTSKRNSRVSKNS